MITRNELPTEIQERMLEHQVAQCNKNYPKVMMVSDYPITEINTGSPRVVFMEKCGKYIAWINADTLEKAETVLDTTYWRYAKDIEPENQEKQELLAKANELILKADELKEMANKL